MSDESAYPMRGYCSHAGYWVREYWYCQEEGCRYFDGLQADDAAGYNGVYPNAGSVAGENDWNNATAGYGGGWYDDYQPGNQEDQDYWYQDGVQPSETNWHHANDQHNDREHGGQYDDDQYDEDQQNDTNQHDADQSGNSHHNDHQPPNPPSDAWATMGSRSSAGQTNSPPLTATVDIDAISTAGNADRDRGRWDPVEQIDVRMNTWGDPGMYNQAGGQFVDPHGYHHGDTPYPHELTLSEGSESSVGQPGVGQSSVERPVPERR